MAVKTARFLAELRTFASVGLDSDVLIYHLEDTKPYSDLTEAAFAAISSGAPRAVLSTVSVTQLMVRPFAEPESNRVDVFERFLLSLPNAILTAPDYAIAKDAARLRARYGIRTPDAHRHEPKGAGRRFRDKRRWSAEVEGRGNHRSGAR